MENLKIVVLSALVTIVAFGMAGLVRHGSFWGEATQVQGASVQRLGKNGPNLPLTTFPDLTARNEPVRIFGLRVRESMALPVAADRMTRLSAAREELKARLIQSGS